MRRLSDPSQFRLEGRVAEHRRVVVLLRNDALDIPLAGLAVAEHIRLEAAVRVRERLVRRETAAPPRSASALIVANDRR